MNRKISKNEKHKYSNKEKLTLGKDQNTSSLINIAQEDDSNIFKLLQNLCINNLWFIILKCSRFCLVVTFVSILLLLYTQMCLIQQLSWLRMERKEQFKSQAPHPPSPTPAIEIFSFFQPPYYSNSPDY